MKHSKRRYALISNPLEVPKRNVSHVIIQKPEFH